MYQCLPRVVIGHRSASLPRRFAAQERLAGIRFLLGEEPILLQSPAAKLGWVVGYHTFGCAVAILTLSRKSWIPAGSRASREQADGARVSCAHAQRLFWCEHVGESQPPPPYCKKMQAPLSKNVGIILYIDVKYTAYIFVHRCKVYCLHFVHRCKVYCLHFCASM